MEKASIRLRSAAGTPVDLTQCRDGRPEAVASGARADATRRRCELFWHKGRWLHRGFVAIHIDQAGKDAAKQVKPEDLRGGKAPYKKTGHARTAQFVRHGEPVPKARNDPALRDIIATDAPYQTSYFGPGYRPVLGPTGSRTRRRPPIPEVPAPQSPVVTWSSAMSHAAESPTSTYVSSDSGHSRRTELYYVEGPADDLDALGSPAAKSHIDERRRFNFDRTQQHIARQRDLYSDNERATADPEDRRQRYDHDSYTPGYRPKDERHHFRPAFRRRVGDYEDNARISGPGRQDRGVDYVRLRMDRERSMLSRSKDYPAARRRRSSREHNYPASLQSEDAESRVLSEDSLDDAELSTIERSYYLPFDNSICLQELVSIISTISFGLFCIGTQQYPYFSAFSSYIQVSEA
jgi:hypothetical protein